MMKTDTVPPSVGLFLFLLLLLFSGTRRKMEFLNGASKHGKVLTAANDRHASCR